ncbi:MAG: EAL domain-containing protein [Campylobacterota bacterium]|nr:EAL domain-containing protein [Campylobacterota bacterium]
MTIQKTFFIFFLITALGYFVTNEYLTAKYSIEKFRESSYEQSRINLNTILDLQMKSVEAIAINLSNDPIVKQGYLQDDPHIIIKHLSTFWNELKSRNLVYEIHFFKPPAISFVNFSNFGSIGHDVARVRKDIKWITSSFKSSKHIMMCKTYAGIRATFPIFAEDGKILGGLSLGKKVDWIPNMMKTVSGNDAFLIYTEASTKTLAPKYLEDFMKNKQHIGNLILADTTVGIPVELIASIDMDKERQTVKINDASYQLGLYPIYDFERNIMAYVASLHSYEIIYSRLWDRLVFNSILLFVLLLGILFFINRYVSSIITRIREIYQITQQYKNKQFKVYKISEKERESRDEVTLLKVNIIEMGESLHEGYENLELKLSEKTKEIQEAYHALKHIHFEDTLTKLPNRFALLRDLPNYKSGTFVIFDIAKFKVVNDTYGVEIGNELLSAVAEFLLQYTNKKDITVYRVGSDEFVGISSKPVFECQQWFSDLFEQIEKKIFHFSDGAIEISVDLNAGISEISEHCFEHATLALGYAKKNQLDYFIYTENLQSLHTYKADATMIKMIKLAILNNRILPYFQAIVGADGKIKKYEALMRLNTGDKILAPNEFLEAAKRSKYYHAMTRIMIQKSLALFRDRSEGVSLNLNMIDIKNTTTVMLIIDELKKFPDASRVTFELVESESMESVSEVLNFIAAIKTHGAKIAIDDFGTGYSNFSYLMEMNPDFIKIDGSLICNIDHDTQAFNIVKSIVEFTHALGIESIGEYVHSQAVFDKAVAMGIDSFQGHYFHQPQADLMESEA